MSEYSRSTGKKVSKTGYVMLFLSLAAMAFFGVCSPQAYDTNLPGIAATVANEEITQAEFRRAHNSELEQIQQRYGHDANLSEHDPATSAMESLVNERALYLEACELGLRASDTEVINAIAEIPGVTDEKGDFAEENFRGFLRSYGYSEASFVEERRRSMTIFKLQQMATQSAFVSKKAAEFDYRASETKINAEYLKLSASSINFEIADDKVNEFIATEVGAAKIKSWFDSRQSDYQRPERVKARHILVAFKGARNAGVAGEKRSKDQAQKRAEQLLKRVNKGESFAEVAKAESDELSAKTNGGELGTFAKDQRDQNVADAAFALEAGKTSRVVESPFGFHIIKTEEKFAGVNRTLADVQHEIGRKLLKAEEGPQLAEESANKIIRLLKDGSDAAALLNENKLTWKKTGPFALNARFIPGLGSQSAVRDAILSLKKDEKLYQNVVKAAQSFYIIRLVSIDEAKMAGFDSKKQKQLARSAAFNQGYGFLTHFQQHALKSLESSGKVYRSEKYLEMYKNADAQNAG